MTEKETLDLPEDFANTVNDYSKDENILQENILPKILDEEWHYYVMRHL